MAPVPGDARGTFGCETGDRGWLSRTDWSEMRVRSTSSLAGCWVMTAIFVAVPAVAISSALRGPAPIAVKLAVCIVALPGALALVLALRATAARAVTGEIELLLDEIPLVPGRTVTATIVTAKPVRPTAVNVGLACKRARGPETGGRRKIFSRWWTVDPESARSDAVSTSIPVEIEIPGDLPARNDPSVPGVRWKLRAWVKASGVSAYASFNLPVYRVGESEIRRR